MGATTRSQVRSDAATVTITGLMTCLDAYYQAPRSRVRFVVVLDVMSSVTSALSARACRIRAETKGRGQPVDRLCLCKSADPAHYPLVSALFMFSARPHRDDQNEKMRQWCTHPLLVLMLPL